MSSDGSITRWIGQLQGGDAAAVQPLWERYFRHLVELARRKLLGARPQIADEEDVALSAFDSFCRGLRRGRFPDLQDRDNLWKMLVVLTARKACHLIRDEQRLKRGGDKRAGAAEDLEQVVAQEPSPEFTWTVAFSPDGKRLASCGGAKDSRVPGEVKIWDMTTGQELLTIPAQAGAVFGVAFSPCGRRLATASKDGNVTLLDGTPLAETPAFQPLQGLTGRIVEFKHEPDLDLAGPPQCDVPEFGEQFGLLVRLSQLFCKIADRLTIALEKPELLGGIIGYYT